MSRISLAVLLIAAVSICTSCTKKRSDETVSNYIIVGHMGSIVSSTTHTAYYLIKDSTVKEDTAVASATVPASFSGFHFNVILSSSAYDSVAGILSEVPAELLPLNHQSIGNYAPDFGYTDVRARVDGADYDWKFQGDQSGSSPAIQAFLRKLVNICN